MVNLNPIIVGLIGGILITVILYLSNKKETAIAAIISTVPLLELFPILFTKEHSTVRLSRDTVVTSISTISALLFTYIALSLWKMKAYVAVPLGFIIWFVIALCLYNFFISKIVK
jgi:uncharacterized membrane protein (GlpM family)